MNTARLLERLAPVLLVAGIVVPYAHVVPWLVEHGPDPAAFLEALFATPVSSFFGWDVIVAVVTLLAVAAFDPGLRRADRIVIALGSLAGASVGLPLYVWLRLRRHRRDQAPHRHEPAPVLDGSGPTDPT